MRFPTPAAVVAAALLTLPGLAAAQSLGEVAAREKARKEKEAKEGKARPPARVFTEDDLRGRLRSGTLSQPQAVDVATPESSEAGSEAKAGTAAPAGGQAAQPEKSEEELLAERQQEWRQKLQEARAEVARLRARVDQLQLAANDMTGPLYSSSRTSLISALEQAKASLATAEQTVANLEEEGRRNRYS